MKSVVIYTYFRSNVANYNLDFFVKKELTYKENIDYIIVINGINYNIKFPELENLTIIRRPNRGFDFGGHATALTYIHNHNKEYDYYFFMNSGVIGPILTSNFKYNHWSEVFINKITDIVKLVGTTIVCLPAHDAGGYGPKVEGFFFMTDKIGLQLLKNEGTIFMEHPDKVSAIVNGEYGLSNCIMKNGYSIDCMLYPYQGIDWKQSQNHNMNNNKHPSRRNSFYGRSVYPYQVIFHKWYWHNEPTVNFEIVKKYVESNS
jgi:hypothetical protein